VTTRRMIVYFLLGILFAYTLPATAEPTRFTRAQVQAAADVVRADPNLPGVQKTRTLRRKNQDDNSTQQPAKKQHWLRGLAHWLAESVRLLMWLVLAALAAFVLVRLPAWLRLRGTRLAAEGATALPARVGALDIRPASLPPDIGNAAALLWQRGQGRAALSLLYRGALSRLIYVHGVPIRAASTEGECLHLAAQRLTPDALRFLAALVRAWQALAWGQQRPASDTVLALCHGFEQQLSPPMPPQIEKAAP